jgi:hypothetical protein
MLDEVLVSEAARDFVAVYDAFVPPPFEDSDRTAAEVEIEERLKELSAIIPGADRETINIHINQAPVPNWSHGKVWLWS